MPNTYTLISSNVLSSPAASVTFSSIPQTYTDLVLRMSIRTDFAGSTTSRADLVINGSTSSIYSRTQLRATAGSLSSFRTANAAILFGTTFADAATATSNIFSSDERYFPNYTGSANKVISTYAVAEDNTSTDATISVQAALFSSTAAITSLQLTFDSANAIAGSSFYLYGIKNS
jgi:hypothetical protein